MGTLFEWGILSLAGVLIFAVLRVLVHLWTKAAKNYNKKLSEDYWRAVENYDKENFHDNKFSVRNGYAAKSKAVDKAKRSVGDYLSVPDALLVSNTSLWDYSTPEVSDDNSSSYEGAGHGGSLGGGGASGSWGSDDNSSSSYSDSSSDSGGSDSSSSD